MSLDKFKQLHDLVINDDSAAARELFHEIVLEKSREIFESMMHDEMDEGMEMEDEMDEGMGGQVGDLLDEINAEESGVTEDDESDIDFDDEEGDMDMMHGDEEGEEAEHEEIEDAVIRIEDKLDQLMAEFEEIMGKEESSDDEDFGGEEDFGDEEDFGADQEDGAEDFDDEDTEEMMEAIQLQKVSVTHGDDGAQKKSTVAANSGQSGMASRPVKFSGASEAVPNSPKAPSNTYTKGEKEVPGAGKFKNSPGHKGMDLDKAPKAKSGDDGANKRSPVAESRRKK
jgi:hypothetical protein